MTKARVYHAISNVVEGEISQHPWRVEISTDLAVRRPDGADVTPRGRKARALLAILVTGPARQIDRETLVGLLWSDRAREQGRASLRQSLVELRGAVAPLLDITQNTVGLTSERLDVVTTPGDHETLSGLNRLDPAFDRWLIKFREHAHSVAVQAAPDAHVPKPGRLFRMLRGWPLPVAVAVAGALVAGALFATRHHPKLLLSNPSPAVAIRPFTILSDDLWSRMTADRIADDVVADMPQVAVVRNEKGVQDAPNSAPIKAGDWIVEGDVLAQPSAFVRARVVSGGGTVLWSRVFDAPRAGPAKLAGDVAGAIATMITCATSAPMKAHTDAAVSMLLAACNSISGPAGWDGEDSIPTLRQFTQKLPDEAFAHALLGTGLAFAALEAPELLARRDRRQAIEELELAERLDRSTGFTYLGRSLLVPRSAPLQAHETLLSHGLAADPDNAYLNLYMADFLAGVGRNDAAVAFSRHALATDPARLEVISGTAQFLAQAGQSRLALQMLDAADQKYSPNRILTAARFTILMRSGDPAGARAILDRASMVPDFVEAAEQSAMRRQTYAIENPGGEAARQIAKELVASAAADPTEASRPVLVLASLGRIDEAIAIGLRQTLVTSVLFRPSSRGLLLDSRFPMVARRQGLWTYWQSTGRWPDICRDPQLHWKCGNR